jgi:fatty-acyl-CoA synthase
MDQTPTAERVHTGDRYETNAAVMVLDRIRRSPLTTAMAVLGEDEWTYAQLGHRVSAATAVLRSQGIGRGDRVAFAAGNGPHIIEYMTAAMALGAVFVPLNTRLSATELEFVITDAGCRLVVADKDLAHHLGPVQDALHAALVGVASAAALPDGWLAADDLVGAEVEPLRETVDTSPDEVAILMYTSGTTGHPKGVMITHDNLLAGVHNLMLIVTFGADSGMLAMTPIFHVAAMALVLCTLGTGGRVVIMPAFSPDGFYDALDGHPITFTFGVPAMLQMLAADERFAEVDLSRLLLMCAGAPVPPALLDLYLSRGAKVTQGYGLTESTGTVSLLEPSMARQKLGSAGLPFPMTSVELRDPEGRVIDEPSVDGEIWAKGRCMVPGYWNRPEETEALHDADGWLRTGDAARFDEDGYLYITDRIKDMIITGGENVYPAEVEKVIAGHPDVAEVAVVGLPDDRWGEAVSAVVVPAPGATPDLDGLQYFAREHLGGYKVPRRLHLVEHLPRNASGKVLKRQLRADLA